MNMFKTTEANTPKEYIDFLSGERKSQIETLHKFILKTLPNLKPFIISGMIGYGKYRYKSKSGKEGDWAVILLASQKNYISIYACGMKDGKYIAEIYKDKLPKLDIGKSCIRIKKLEDLDFKILEKILKESEQNPLGKV